MTNKKFDVVVIGAGPAGYVAAIRASQLGLSVACIERMHTLGGTCLNIGCIPSKALLHASEEFKHAQKGMNKHGIKIDGVSLDLSSMMAHKDDVVDQLTKGIDMLFKKNDVEHIQGDARIISNQEVEVTATDKEKTIISGANIIIATGSTPADLPGAVIDEKQIVSSTGALRLTKVPEHLVVIGAGYIGLELGSVWGRLGAKVTVVEYLNRITPGMDEEVASQFQRLLKRQKIKFKLGTKVTELETYQEGVKIRLESVSEGKNDEIDADVVLLAIGRIPHTSNLGLDNLGINIDDRGFIKVDDHYKTNVDGIYAIGDVIPGPMLAHKAEEEGVAVAELISGEKSHVNYDAIPSVIYTNPEVASVGKTEEQLKEEGREYKVGSFPFVANGRARAISSTDGFVKILACATTDKVLGVHIIGTDAGTLIAEAVLAIEFGGSAEDIARTCHAHPALNEAIKEAALAVDNRAIHF
tara:strand:+ start:17279 stop:18688 length:1410 start_codon:yes stop_codon:yes gene_type:complete